ncbi:translation initiation factor IF-2-like isoform X1 [Falco biarmicus]|uniref:translation initiation factor IF-2-like isoform X1 n=1 Tax=Falco cherrug TaxID=345164 RepID=UPI002478B148|nr:translation initiation factor IF-2-like isoform X1 [Falco cherrug]XP_056195758.1 translation initiation factor IF-2-like isoform X1 [Falco biarmicus]
MVGPGGAGPNSAAPQRDPSPPGSAARPEWKARRGRSACRDGAGGPPPPAGVAPRLRAAASGGSRGAPDVAAGLGGSSGGARRRVDVCALVRLAGREALAAAGAELGRAVARAVSPVGTPGSRRGERELEPGAQPHGFLRRVIGEKTVASSRPSTPLRAQHHGQSRRICLF